jgi:TPR repeat protein
MPDTLRSLAENGDSDAQFELGRAYANGTGVPQDHSEAAVWWRKTAEQGHAESQYCLGFACWLGDGPPQDREEAVAWYRKATV